MGRDLSFWKYKNSISMNDNEVYQKLSNGETLDVLEELPKSDILRSLRESLSGWDELDETHYEKGNELIEVYATSQFVRFDCYQVSAEHMNKLIDVMLAYDCPLYDSSIDVRFEL